MDIDIIRDQKLGAGAGMRSSRVRMSSKSHVSARKSKFILWCVKPASLLRVPAHSG